MVKYWTWNGLQGDEPTQHFFEYGLINIWEEGLTTDLHALDNDPPTLKQEVLDDLELWGGEWLPTCIQIRFKNDYGALMFKMKYHPEEKKRRKAWKTI